MVAPDNIGCEMRDKNGMRYNLKTSHLNPSLAQSQEKHITEKASIASPIQVSHFIASMTEQSNLMIVVAVLILIAAMVLIYKKRSSPPRQATYNSVEVVPGR